LYAFDLLLRSIFKIYAEIDRKSVFIVHLSTANSQVVYRPIVAKEWIYSMGLPEPGLP
jgi:hypothetical protein